MKILNIILVFILSFSTLQTAYSSVSYYDVRIPETADTRVKKEKKPKKEKKTNELPKSIKVSYYISFTGILVGSLGLILISTSISSGSTGAFVAGIIFGLLGLILCWVGLLILAIGMKKESKKTEDGNTNQ